VCESVVVLGLGRPQRLAAAKAFLRSAQRTQH
jgi:hypothetical protein